MQLTINDTNNLSELDIRILALLVPQKAQPAVAENTGTTALVTPPSTEGSGVSEPVVEQSTPAASEKKERKPRAKKEEPVQAEVVVDEPTDEPEPEVAAEPKPVEQAAPAVDAKPLSLDEVRAALQLFTGKHGMQAAIKLLGEFGAGRISELKPEQYAAFAEKCGE